MDSERLESLARPREHKDSQDTSADTEREQRELDTARMSELAMPRRRSEPEELSQSDAERGNQRIFDRSRMTELAMPRCILEPPPQPSAAKPRRHASAPAPRARRSSRDSQDGEELAGEPSPSPARQGNNEVWLREMARPKPAIEAAAKEVIRAPSVGRAVNALRLATLAEPRRNAVDTDASPPAEASASKPVKRKKKRSKCRLLALVQEAAERNADAVEDAGADSASNSDTEDPEVQETGDAVAATRLEAVRLATSSPPPWPKPSASPPPAASRSLSASATLSIDMPRKLRQAAAAACALSRPPRPPRPPPRGSCARAASAEGGAAGNQWAPVPIKTFECGL